jgi:lipoprotein-anchoring transpeptidase ErfK/SrfK
MHKGMSTRRLVCAALTLLGACSGDSGSATDDAAPAAPAPGVTEPAAPYPPAVTSLRLRRSASVHLRPASASPRIGTVARDVRVRWTGAAVGAGCKGRWVEIAPRGWVCDRHLQPSDREPYDLELPRVAAGALVPGVYGRVVAENAPVYASVGDVRAGKVHKRLKGAVKVRRQAVVSTDRGAYWRIGADELIAATAVEVIEPSPWQGIDLSASDGPQLPLGFALRPGARTRAVSVYGSPQARGKPVRVVPPRSVVAVLERAGEWVRIGDSEWVPAAHVRIAEQSSPPDMTDDDERWIDVDLDQQVLVAYEGMRPTYVTLVSTGAVRHPTDTGVYRVWIKFSETDMSGRAGDEAGYSVADVPWTQFYARDLALHAAYWHDKFGVVTSHGCVNLAPRDARHLYGWSRPEVPRGWTMAHGTVELPGSMVRVRSAADPQPGFKGYAQRVYEARRARRVLRTESPPDRAPG